MLLVFDNAMGQIVEGEKKLVWLIRVMKHQNEPLVGDCPLIFDTEKERNDFMNSKDGKQYMDERRSQGYIIKTEEVTMIVI